MLQTLLGLQGSIKLKTLLNPPTQKHQEYEDKPIKLRSKDSYPTRSEKVDLQRSRRWT